MFPLADLVSPEGDLLLDTLDFGSDKLPHPVVICSRTDDYKKALEYVSNVKVVNDIGAGSQDDYYPCKRNCHGISANNLSPLKCGI